MVTNSALNCGLAHYGTEPVINMTHYMFVTSCFHHNLICVELNGLHLLDVLTLCVFL